MKAFSAIFWAVTGLTALSALGAVAAPNDEVSVEADIQVLIRRGILPVRVESADAKLSGAVRRALGLHGAFDVNAASCSAAVIRVSRDGNGLSAQCSGTSRAFAGTLSVAGTGDAALAELCDRIVVAVGKTYGWNLKPLFAKTRLAFSSDATGAREIYFSDLLCRDVRRATSHRRIAIMPYWDTNGRRLLYTTYHASGAADVYSVDLKTGRYAPFATYPNTNNGGAFSPDGRRVALALSARGVMNIYVKPATGGNATALCADGEVQTSPVFSPDGRTVVFTSGPNGRPGLYRVPARGGKKERIALSGYSYATDPAWSKAAPDKIAFSYRFRTRRRRRVRREHARRARPGQAERAPQDLQPDVVRGRAASRRRRGSRQELVSRRRRFRRRRRGEGDAAFADLAAELLRPGNARFRVRDSRKERAECRRIPMTNVSPR